MSKMSTLRHLRELQWRMMLVAAFFVIGACLAYAYQAYLIPIILGPLHGEQLIYLNPAGGFSFIFLISIYAGIALSFPVLVQQLYAFLRPALPLKAQKKSPLIILSSFLLLVTGVLFGYFVAVPNALAFLFEFADQYVQASLTADSYLNFIIAYTIGIGIVFQIPLLLLLIDTIKPMSPGGLLKSEKWVIVIAFIVAAIITPTPDPINQAIIAGPVIVIYQLGVIAVLVSIARRKRAAKRSPLPVQATAAAARITSSPQVQPVQTTRAEPTASLASTQKSPPLRSIDGVNVKRRSTLYVPQRPARTLHVPARVERPLRTSPGLYMDVILPNQIYQ